MSAQTGTASAQRTVDVAWTPAVGSGLLAGVVFGLMVHFGMGVMPMIGALYGVQSAAFGWIAHLFHSVVFAGLYAVTVTREPLATWTEGLGARIGLGLIYGVAIWFVAAAYVMPIWLSAVGAAEPPVPNLVLQSLIGHAVFGSVLCVAYGVWTDEGAPA